MGKRADPQQPSSSLGALAPGSPGKQARLKTGEEKPMEVVESPADSKEKEKEKEKKGKGKGKGKDIRRGRLGGC